MDDTRPFPIQGGWTYSPTKQKSVDYEPSTIPWWLAEIAYEHYVKLFGPNFNSLETLAERGGFGRRELVVLLCKEYRL